MKILIFALLTLSTQAFANENLMIREGDGPFGHVTEEVIEASIQKMVENGVDNNLKYFEVIRKINHPKYPHSYLSAVLFYCNEKYQYSPYSNQNVFPGALYGVFKLPENSSLAFVWDYVCSKEQSPVLDFANVTPRLKQIFDLNNETAKMAKKKIGL